MSDISAAVARLNDVIAALESNLAAERARVATEKSELSGALDAAQARIIQLEAAHSELAAELQQGGQADQAALEEAQNQAQELRRERDAARADAEASETARGEAEARIAELETARTDDAKLRAEAADALDAAIGELKTLSSGGA